MSRITDIIANARLTLRDNGARYTDARMLSILSDGQRDITKLAKLLRFKNTIPVSANITEYSCGVINYSAADLVEATTESTQVWTGVAYNGTIFAAVGTNAVMTSYDGTIWEDQASIPARNWKAIAWNGTVFAAVASSGTGDRVMTSPDGITWTSRTSAADNNWTAIAWNGTVFAAVASSGTGNRVMTSPDGITWTSRTSAADNSWSSVIWTGYSFISSATSSSPNNLMYSLDGITWVSASTSLTNAIPILYYANNLIIALADSAAWSRAAVTEVVSTDTLFISRVCDKDYYKIPLTTTYKLDAKNPAWESDLGTSIDAIVIDKQKQGNITVYPEQIVDYGNIYVYGSKLPSRLLTTSSNLEINARFDLALKYYLIANCLLEDKNKASRSLGTIFNKLYADQVKLSLKAMVKNNTVKNRETRYNSGI